MAKLKSLELLNYIEGAVLNGKTLQEQCLDTGYRYYNGNPDFDSFLAAVRQAERHVEILKSGLMHPFLLHAYTTIPVSMQSKKVNALIDELCTLVDLVFIDDLEDDFMDNFDEIGNPDGDLYEYEFGAFESKRGAMDFILDELDSAWWARYYTGVRDSLVEHRRIKGDALSLMSRIEKVGGNELLDEIVKEAIRNQFEGVLGEPGRTVSTNIYMREWEGGSLVAWMGDGSAWKNFYASLRRSCDKKGIEK
jgi:hypothetical protein